MDNTVAVLVPASEVIVPVQQDNPGLPPVAPGGDKMVKADRLGQFLEKNNARRLWETQQPGVTVAAYSIFGTVVVTTVFAGRNRAGWELYIPAAKTNKVDDTLQAAAAFIGNGCVA